MNPRKPLSKPVSVIVLLFGVALAGDVYYRTVSYYYETPPPSGLEQVRLLSPSRIEKQVDVPQYHTILGAVYAANLTTAPGANPTLEYHIGVGDVGVPPRLWTEWTTALYAGDEAGSDKFSYQLSFLRAVGEYRFTVRARIKGEEWVYGDLDGSANGIQDSQLGVLIVTDGEPQPTDPCPDSLAFHFQYSQNGWNFVAPTNYVPPDSLWTDTADGELILLSTNNTNTFGYFDSPYVDVTGVPTIVSPLDRADTAAYPVYGDLYRAEFRVRSAVADRARTPQFRVRTNALHLQQGSYLAMESRDDGAYSPDAEGRTYTLYFAQPPTDGVAQFSLDLLNFDPTDDPQADISLDWMKISRCLPIDLNDAALVYRYTFDAGQEGWIPQASIQFTVPTFGYNGGALTLAGSGTADCFGFFVSPLGDIVIDSSLLYIVTFEVESTLLPGDRDLVPQFRLRLNEQDMHAASVVAVRSLGDAANSPVVGDPREYIVFFQPLPSSHGKSLILSFDLLDFDAQDDVSAAVHLNRVDVQAIAYP